jgi:hypothetical protein
MEFLHKVKMQVLEASFIVRTPTLKIRVLDDKDHFDHERIKEGFSLLDVHDSTHDGTKFAHTFTTSLIELTQPMPSMTVLPLVQWESGTRLSSLFCALASP